MFKMLLCGKKPAAGTGFCMGWVLSILSGQRFFGEKKKRRHVYQVYETPPLTNAPSGTRTLDLVIKSHLLYQLS
jgi:hypothetical protein